MYFISTIEDYFQEIGRAERSGGVSTSTIMWKPSDAPLWKDLSGLRHAEIAAVRHYLENDIECSPVTPVLYEADPAVLLPQQIHVNRQADTLR